ncbi:Non-ribosomal peptide synthetase component F [Pseudomonas syringae pv. actinidiae]|uniref:Non-ribosomal peptide synthetase component F n=1 Tax=Pseudomonas syringae pv. actinidiae TaxID=103796 RepID=A0A2V0QBZ7_PSESF|nr:Non-ribosomal peptide synthetase component F [Pseudomonas syringae pv. actinidiae]GBH18469.1 Non-ribosomal peptide synthetase component F [Pseudomonas syringae pv. actinidiae]
MYKLVPNDTGQGGQCQTLAWITSLCPCSMPVTGSEFQVHRSGDLTMIALQYRRFLPGLCLLLCAAQAHATDAMIIWPAGWEVESLPTESDTPVQPSVQVRQRAVKNDQSGNPLMVMELTQTRLSPGHEVNVQGVLLEMRKSVQVNFARSGLQSVCTHVRESQLSVVPALETTCTITQNGVHVLTQTLVAAANKEMAWSLSYAGSAEGYAANKDEALRIRESLRLDAEQ